jgi:hypothetical protein
VRVRAGNMAVQHAGGAIGQEGQMTSSVPNAWSPMKSQSALALVCSKCFGVYTERDDTRAAMPEVGQCRSNCRGTVCTC